VQRQTQSPRASGGGGRGAVIQRMIPTTADGWEKTRYKNLQNAQEWAAFLTEIDEEGNTFEADGGNVKINGKAYTYTAIRNWINIAPEMLKQTCDKTRAAKQTQSQQQVGGSYMPSSYPASSGYPQYPGYQSPYPHVYPQSPMSYGNYPMGAPQQQFYPSRYMPTQYVTPQSTAYSPYGMPTQSNYQPQPLPGHLEAKATSSVSSSSQPKPTTSNKQLIVQTEIMTGDMYVIMQALKMTPYTYVLLLHGSSGKESTAASIIQFYKECLKGQYGQKVFTEKVGDVDATRKYLTQAAYNKREQKSPIKIISPEGENLFRKYSSMGYELYAPGIASSISAQNYKGFREAITEGEDTERFFAYFEKLGIQKGKPYIVVWSRLSGKRGGLHPESDTSRTGNLNIIEAIKKQFSGAGIIVAGDTPNKGYAVEGVIDLTEFWGANKNPKFPGSGRKDQLLMWIALDKFTGGIKHVGMRSGAIEAMPSLGMKTVMILDKDNAQMLRSEKLKSIEHFRLAQVNKLATRKGKYWQQNPDILKLPTPTRPGEEQKVSLQRGFDEPDLQTIMSALKS
jgi:hypothetical protein